jgi:hypothetical protein
MAKGMGRMTQEQYENRRSWLIDTAETPQDKKNLAKDLANLDKQYRSSNFQPRIGGHAN